METTTIVIGICMLALMLLVGMGTYVIMLLAALIETLKQAPAVTAYRWSVLHELIQRIDARLAAQNATLEAAKAEELRTPMGALGPGMYMPQFNEGAPLGHLQALNTQAIPDATKYPGPLAYRQRANRE
jgi:hypothetical protein